jgi:hypothetical protein
MAMMELQMENWIRVLSVVGLLLIAGCRLAPVYNQPTTPHNAPPGTTLEQVTEAIKQAGISLGWRMSVEEPGRMIGTLHLRSHEAVVQVLYDTESYSITYLNSTNLKYDGQRIHKNYNSWVQNLSNAIYARISSI